MGYVLATANPAKEPISLAEAKNYLRLDPSSTQDEAHISMLISAAREHAERITAKAIAQRTFRQVMDSMPYYTDTIQSQLAYPPNYYSLPRYSTTLWNYSQMIKLFYPPVVSVQQIRFVDANGNAQALHQDVDFVLDRQTYPARIFPIPGAYWPPNYYVPNSCEIDFTAGYCNDTAAAPSTHAVAGGATVAFSGGGGSGAAGVPVIVGGAVVAIVITSPGTGYTSAPAIAITGGGGTGATATATLTGTTVTGATITAGGSGYTLNPPGQQPDSIVPVALPATLKRIMLLLLNFWYDNRSAEAPPEIDSMLMAEACIDFQPTRG